MLRPLHLFWARAALSWRNWLAQHTRSTALQLPRLIPLGKDESCPKCMPSIIKKLCYHININFNISAVFRASFAWKVVSFINVSMQVTVVWGQPRHYERVLPAGWWPGHKPGCCVTLHYLHTSSKWFFCWCVNTSCSTEPLHSLSSPQKLNLVLCLPW